MMNVFSVVMAYSITCPIIVPFGESSLRAPSRGELHPPLQLGAPEHPAPSGSGGDPGPADPEGQGRGQVGQGRDWMAIYRMLVGE